jgi:hypothetical protein
MLRDIVYVKFRYRISIQTACNLLYVRKAGAANDAEAKTKDDSVMAKVKPTQSPKKRSAPPASKEEGSELENSSKSDAAPSRVVLSRKQKVEGSTEGHGKAHEKSEQATNKGVDTSHLEPQEDIKEEDPPAEEPPAEEAPAEEVGIQTAEEAPAEEPAEEPPAEEAAELVNDETE